MAQNPPTDPRIGLAIAVASSDLAAQSKGVYTYLRQIKRHPVIALVRGDTAMSAKDYAGYSGFDGVVVLTKPRLPDRFEVASRRVSTLDITTNLYTMK